MPYCTQQNLEDRFSQNELIQLTDENGLGVIDVNAVALAISDADGKIDAYLSSRFNVPITPEPKSLVTVACDIARYFLYDDNATDHVSDRYKEAIKFLKDVAAGKATIGVDSAGAKPESQNLPEFESDGNVFNRKDTSYI